MAYADNAQLWRDRAEEARVIADGMAKAEPRRMMTSIAEGYDRMALRAEERRAAHPAASNAARIAGDASPSTVSR